MCVCVDGWVETVAEIGDGTWVLQIPVFGETLTETVRTGQVP